MAKIVTGVDPGPVSTRMQGGQVVVTLREAGPTDIELRYDDLDTLNETAKLFTEAVEKMTRWLVAERGRTRSVRQISEGDRIVLRDLRIIEVNAVTSAPGDQIGISFYEDGVGVTHYYPTSAEVTWIR